MDLLAKKVKEIEMPDDMRKRMIENCNREIYDMNKEKMNCVGNDKGKMGETGMKLRKENNFWKKQLPIAVAFVLCVCITGVTTLAATGKLEGYFKDITKWNGAVVGTSYEQATEEIMVDIGEVGEELSVLITIINAENPPYSEAEEFGIAEYQIEDMEGKIVSRECVDDKVPMNREKMNIKIPLDSLEKGTYKLIIEAFVSEKKADQPLIIHGNWECEFEY